MPVAEKEQSERTTNPANTALKAAAAAAATGAATYAVKKLRSGDHASNEDGDGDGGGESRSKGSGRQSVLAAAASTGWEAAADALMPAAEEAAEAAGRYLATHGPEIVRDKIVPKFIEAFNDAK